MIWVELEDLPKVAEITAKSVADYINKSSTPIKEKVIADIIQSSLEGWVCGTMDRLNRAEFEMEDD